jgi:hypothetical protein
MVKDVCWDLHRGTEPMVSHHRGGGLSGRIRRKENVMFHHRHDKAGSNSPIASPPVKTVRLLQGDEELQEAIERAKGFESRGFDEYKRRMGTYDRFMTRGQGHPTNVLPIEPSAEAS